MNLPTEVQAVIDRLATLTNDEAEQLAPKKPCVRSWSWCEAWGEAWDAIVSQGKSEILNEAWIAVGAGTGDTACGAILAYLAGDAITPEHRYLLSGPWEQVIR